MYGATLGGGANAGGTLFEISSSPDGKKWTYQVLHDFCAKAQCRDGAIVLGPLVVDTVGALYGLATVGGRDGSGLIFKLAPNADRSVWTYQILTEICPGGGANCNLIGQINFGLTYAGANSGELYDGVSPLYGTSTLGGSNMEGTVFAVRPRRGRTGWSFDVIHAFCDQQGCPDGESPEGNVTVDSAGHLFGTARWGGANSAGVLFELQEKKHVWAETVLHDFCALPACGDGESPGALTQDSAGNLLGFSEADQNSCAVLNDCSLLFQFTAGSAWREHVLHRFCKKDDCRDGSLPEMPILSPSGDVFGATSYGGGHDIDDDGKGGGTVFRRGSTFGVLYRFCRQPACADGEYPRPNIIVDSAGNIFGLTQRGGPHGSGVVFELTP